MSKGLELVHEGPELLLVMEYILGSQLKYFNLILNKHSTDIRIKVAVAVGIAIAKALIIIKNWPLQDGKLLYLIHGDISAQNIIIGVDGQVKLIDFGMAIRASKQQNCKQSITGDLALYVA